MKKNHLVTSLLLAVTMVFTGCSSSGNNDAQAVYESLGTAEESIAFIDEIYANVEDQDILPYNVLSTELSLTDLDLITYSTGLQSVDGITSVVVSESMLTSTPYSLIYVTTQEGADVEAIQNEIVENVNIAKWICVSAESTISVTLGNDILFVMGYDYHTSAIYDALVKVAGQHYTVIGEKVENTYTP